MKTLLAASFAFLFFFGCKSNSTSPNDSSDNGSLTLPATFTGTDGNYYVDGGAAYGTARPCTIIVTQSDTSAFICEEITKDLSLPGYDTISIKGKKYSIQMQKDLGFSNAVYVFNTPLQISEHSIIMTDSSFARGDSNKWISRIIKATR